MHGAHQSAGRHAAEGMVRDVRHGCNMPCSSSSGPAAEEQPPSAAGWWGDRHWWLCSDHQLLLHPPGSARAAAVVMRLCGSLCPSAARRALLSCCRRQRAACSGSVHPSAQRGRCLHQAGHLELRCSWHCCVVLEACASRPTAGARAWVAGERAGVGRCKDLTAALVPWRKLACSGRGLEQGWTCSV